MKIGILGGTFNPPHNSHKKLISNLLDGKILDKVIVLTTNNKYEKPDIINLSHRINMLNLAMDREDVVIENEATCKSLNYTIDALNYYKEKYQNDEILFVMGSDNLKDFKNWHNYEEIVNNFRLIVTNRNDDNIDELKYILPTAKIQFVTNVGALSSSFVRNEIKNGNLVDNYLDEKVIEYIEKNNLYK
jgi:nicotinate-nucleotide adenylyltransferase